MPRSRKGTHASIGSLLITRLFDTETQSQIIGLSIQRFLQVGLRETLNMATKPEVVSQDILSRPGVASAIDIKDPQKRIQASLDSYKASDDTEVIAVFFLYMSWHVDPVISRYLNIVSWPMICS